MAKISARPSILVGLVAALAVALAIVAAAAKFWPAAGAPATANTASPAAAAPADSGSAINIANPNPLLQPLEEEEQGLLTEDQILVLRSGDVGKLASALYAEGTNTILCGRPEEAHLARRIFSWDQSWAHDWAPHLKKLGLPCGSSMTLFVNRVEETPAAGGAPRSHVALEGYFRDHTGSGPGVSMRWIRLLGGGGKLVLVEAHHHH